MKKKLVIILCWILLVLNCCPVYASDLPKKETPNYKVSYYYFDCFNMQDEYGQMYGYGYDMMQSLSNYMQCTFSYVGYDLSAQECVELLRKGEIDIYTAAKYTLERAEEFAFSKYPAITATTCMNVKRGNKSIIAGDYTTYNGITVGLLQRHTYNDSFKRFLKDNNIDCEIIYYDTPTDLSNALVDGSVDAIVDSYIRTPEDEITIENFGETPYYFMVRKEDKALVDKIDEAIDSMNIETPNWRSELYNIYYGSQDANTKFTSDEQLLLKSLQEDGSAIRVLMDPDCAPYSWLEDGQGHGIVYDIFVQTVHELGLNYELIDVSSKEEYENVLENGDVDIWIDQDYYYPNDKDNKYKSTDTYLTTSVSALRKRGTSGKINRVGLLEDNIAMRKIIDDLWPDVQVEIINNSQECVDVLVNNKVDCVLLMSYTAQRLAREDTQNRFSVDIVPGASIELKMGVNADIDYNFYGIWNKTLAEVSNNKSATIVQDYLEMENKPTLLAFLFDNPSYIVAGIGIVSFMVIVFVLYLESLHSKHKQEEISKQLSKALLEAKKANDAKFNFFSKMSHDIRTPMNAVLGMTQIAKKYKNDPVKLEKALDSVTYEGNYLLNMINSILDINQLEHGHIELINKAFDINESLEDSIKLLRPLALNKEQKLEVVSNCQNDIVVGDASRFSQIVINIVSNAIKYTGINGDIEVSLEKLSNNNYLFRCKDNGIGMSEEFVKHICEDYSRADDSVTSKIEGTGLGMSVVKRLVDLMEGKLNIESELGKGSTFSVELPFGVPTVEEKESMLKSFENDLDKKTFVGKRVMLVEDNALNAEIGEELLEEIGFMVDWAENGKLAYEMFEKSAVGTYYAIFMDMQMPVMDGVETCRLIRKLDREDNDILIIAMSANTLTRDRQRCIEAGMNAYLSKPVNLNSIVRILREHMR